MGEEIRVVAFIYATPGHENAVEEAALACVAPTQGEDGNIMYVLHRDAKEPGLFVFVEHWKSQSALDQHMQTAHFKRLAGALGGKLAKPLAIHVLTPV